MKVSVLVATYNPTWENLKLTIDSIIVQKDIDIELVVSDDGSKNNLFIQLEQYLKGNKFENYFLTELKENAGTVKNIVNGLNYCTGDFAKLISPGDYFVKDTTLADWTKHLIDSKKRWSIGKAVYYFKDQENHLQKAKQDKHPVLVDVYEKQLDNKIRWNYLVLDDIGLGAAIYSETRLLKEYIKRIEGKVLYAEDNCYRIMAFDNIIPDYYSNDVINYECGTGVSTSKNNDWKTKLLKDWRATDLEMINNPDETDAFQKKIIRYLKDPNRTKMIKKLFQPGRIRFAIKKRW